MYYLIDWFGYYIVYDDASNCLASGSSKDIQDAINLFKESNWDITTQPNRNIHLTSTHLIDDDARLKILGKFKSLDNVQTSNPELFI